MHVFPYSSRPGTTASHFPDDVRPEIKNERVWRLIALSRQQGAKYRSRFVGTTRTVLWESRKYDKWTGLTDNYLRAAAHSDDDLSNQMTEARLVRLDGAILLAEVASPIMQPTNGGTP